MEFDLDPKEIFDDLYQTVLKKHGLVHEWSDELFDEMTAASKECGGPDLRIMCLQQELSVSYGLAPDTSYDALYRAIVEADGPDESEWDLGVKLKIDDIRCPSQDVCKAEPAPQACREDIKNHKRAKHAVNAATGALMGACLAAGAAATFAGGGGPLAVFLAAVANLVPAVELQKLKKDEAIALIERRYYKMKDVTCTECKKVYRTLQQEGEEGYGLCLECDSNAADHRAAKGGLRAKEASKSQCFQGMVPGTTPTPAPSRVAEPAHSAQGSQSLIKSDYRATPQAFKTQATLPVVNEICLVFSVSSGGWVPASVEAVDSSAVSVKYLFNSVRKQIPIAVLDTNLKRKGSTCSVKSSSGEWKEATLQEVEPTTQQVRFQYANGAVKRMSLQRIAETCRF